MTPESASQQRGVDAGAGAPGETGMEKGYVPAKHEGRIASRWAEAGVFAADPGRVNRGERKAYAVLIPPPNVTDRLHLGHALNNTLQDVLVRAHRMMGYETLWMPGTDHAGIATQAVVERRLRKDGKLKGPLRTSMKREEFVATVQAFKDEYEATITGQLRAMGCSCDWDRQRFTMDAQCTAAVREAFFRLFKDGLIYRGKRLVNWDPVLQTAVADDECYDEEIEGAFYYLRYPLAAGREGGAVTWGELAARGYPGAGEHAPGEAAWVTVATTRPETYLGDTAVGVNPHDPRAAALRGLWVQLPLVGRVVPIVEDGYVVLPERYARTEEEKRDPKAGMATGFLKVTPAHDTNDYEIGRRHGLAMVNVFAPDATVSDKHGWSDVGGASRFVGLKREEARKQVVEAFKELGLLEAVKPHRHSVKHSDRSKAVVEPYLSDQWYVKVTDPSMAAAANDALYTGQLTFHPQRYLKTYEQWHDTIRDWCISRQLWWGHRIPVFHIATTSNATSSDQNKREFRAKLDEFLTAAGADPADVELRIGDQILDTFAAVRTEAALLAMRALALVHHGRIRDSRVKSDGSYHRDNTLFEIQSLVGGRGEAAYMKAAELRPYVQICGEEGDVLDTWFSSALWPMSTMGWPEPGKFAGNAGMLEAFNPTSVLCTAREIITLWVSRMVMFNRYFMGAGKGRGPAPFRDVFIHAVIQDGEGRKMSKSLGNGVDPLDIIASHGADAMRFTLASMTTQTQDVRMPVQKDAATGRNTSPKFDLGRNFANKLWNAARFALTMVPRGGSAGGPVSRGDLTLADRWMLSRLAGATAKVNAALGQYEFSVYAQTMYDLLWRDYCDWYLEAVKPTVAQRPAQQAVLVHALRTILRLLHPIMPFVTEAVHEQSRGIAAAEIPGLRLGPERVGGLLCTAPWPEIDGAWADAEADAAFGRAQEIVEAILRARSEHKVPPRKRITLHAPAAIVREVELAGGVVQTRADLERATAEAPAAGSSLITVPLGAAELLLSGAVEALDAGAERERLVKLIGELDKSIGALEGRLANPGYAQRAPAKLVEESRQQLEAKKAEREAARASLGRLEG